MERETTRSEPLDYATPQPRSASGELGKIIRHFTFLFSLIRPFVFAAGLGFVLYGLGASIQSHIDGPSFMGLGGVVVGISLPWWRVRA
jgi:hypothetical protein